MKQIWVGLLIGAVAVGGLLVQVYPSSPAGRLKPVPAESQAPPLLRSEPTPPVLLQATAGPPSQAPSVQPEPKPQDIPTGQVLEEWKRIWATNMPVPDLVKQATHVPQPSGDILCPPSSIPPPLPPSPPTFEEAAQTGIGAVSPVEAKLQQVLRKLEKIETRLDALQQRKEEKLLRQADKMLQRVEQLEQRLQDEPGEEAAASDRPGLYDLGDCSEKLVEVLAWLFPSLCQTYVPGMTLPSPYYLKNPPPYIPPSPDFPLRASWRGRKRFPLLPFQAVRLKTPMQ